MQWSKKQALEELQFFLKKWEHPPFPSPSFHQELYFLDFFAFLIERMPGTGDIIPAVEEMIELALKNSFLQICRVLNKHEEADGSEIFNLASENKFLTISVMKAYNRKVMGKSPKGLRRTDWIAYNTWLLASVFWKAFKDSYHSDVQLYIPVDEYPETPHEVLLQADYKPLWAMRLAYKSAGIYIGFDGDYITVRPHAEWYRFLKQKVLLRE